MCSTVFRRKKLVLYSFQEKETGTLLFSGKGNLCSTVFRRRELVLLLFSGERNWYTQHYCSQDRRRKQVLYCSQEKGKGALRFSRRRKLVFYCSQEKETGALSTTVYRIGEGKMCSTVLRRRKLVHSAQLFTG